MNKKDFFGKKICEKCLKGTGKIFKQSIFIIYKALKASSISDLDYSSSLLEKIAFLPDKEKISPPSPPPPCVSSISLGDP